MRATSRNNGVSVLVALILGHAGVSVIVAPSRAAGPEGIVVRAYVTNFGGDGVSVIDPVAGRLVADIRTGSKPHGVATAHDGTAVFVSNEGDRTMSVIDPASNRVAATIPVGKGPNQLSAAADGRHVVVTLHEENAAAVIDVAARRVAKVVPIGRAPHIALASPDGKSFYVTSEGNMKLVALDARTWTPTAETSLLAFPRVVAVAPDGNRLYQTIRWLNGALVLDPRHAMVVDRIAVDEPVFAAEGKDAHGLAVTPDSRQLWLTTQTTNSVTVIGTADNKVIGTIFVGRNPNWVAFTPDGKIAVVSNTDSNDASIVDVAERRVISTVETGPSPKRLAVGAVIVAEARKRSEIVHSFDDVAAGKLPEGWRIDATIPKGRLAEWAVVPDSKAPSAPMVLALTRVHDFSSGVFNLCWNSNVRFRDGEIEVSARAQSGKEDQGGGPIWRVHDAENYYVARYNPLERNFRLYYVKNGRRHELASASRLDIETGQWFTIRIVQTGSHMEGWIDGKKLLEAEDGTLPGAGGVGVWTKADAATAFDNLRIRASD